MRSRKPPHSSYPIFEGVGDCSGCPLEKKEREEAHPDFGGFVLPEGHPDDSSVLALGEAPGENERLKFRPFIGAAGFQHQKHLRLLRLPRNALILDNVVRCQPPKNWLAGAPWEKEAISHCSRYLHASLRHFNPKVILTLGDISTRTILGSPGAVVGGHAPRRGYIFRASFGDWFGYVVPTIHPSHIIRGKQNLSILAVDDINKALNLASVGRAPWEDYDPEYVTHPNFADCDAFERRAGAALGGDVWLTCDIETEESPKKSEEDYDEIEDAEITRVAFAYRGGYGISIPWEAAFLPYIQAILSLNTPYIVYWSWPFDHPRLISKGMSIPHKILDGMSLWHWYRTALPQSLGSVSANLTDLAEWKSKFESDLPEYSCTDVDAAIRNTYSTRDAMIAENRFDIFLRHEVEITPLLTQMHKKGMLLDQIKQDSLRKWLSQDLKKVDDEVQKVIPDPVKPYLHYKMVPISFRCRECCGKGYTVKTRTRTRRRVVVEKWKEISPCESCGRLGFLGGKIPPPWTHIVNKHSGVFLKSSAEKLWEDGKLRPLWMFRQKFLPTSPKQVAKYLRSRGFKIPLNYKTERETTDIKAILELIRKHPRDPVLPLFLDYRKLKKLIGQYIDGYVPWEDGRIHTTFARKTQNLRYNSVNPNVQNVTKTSQYAQAIREQFIAAPGFVLGEVDHSGAEAQILGFYAKDEEYIEAAKLGVHSILASHCLVESGDWKDPIDLKSWSKDDIHAAAEEIKHAFPLIYKRAKNCVHGSGYGAVAYKLWKEYREAFPTLRFAEEIQDLFFNTIGKKIKIWHRDTLDFVYDNHYLENVYRYRFEFWDIYKTDWSGKILFDKNGNKKLGDQAKDALAYNPSSTEAAYITEAMLEFKNDSFFRSALVWQIHDSLVWELPDDSRLEERLRHIQTVMTRPSPEMDGLSIEVGMEWGKNWGEKSKKNPDGMKTFSLAA